MPPPLPPSLPSLAARIRRMFGWGSLTIIVLVIGGCLVENYRGHYVWKKYRQECEAKGEQFDLTAFVPKPVPPAQNFAATPFFAPYLDYTIAETDREHPHHWKDRENYERNKELAMGLGILNSKQKKAPDAGSWQIGTFTDLRLWQDYFAGNTNFPFATPPKDPASDVLTALQRYDAVLDELHAASTRPYSAFPVHYDEHLQALLPHLASLKNLAQVISLRALAHLDARHPDKALQDVQFGLRLADTLKSEGFLISGLVRIGMADLILQPIWEGLARQRWDEAQLAELQATLSRVNILEDYGPTMRTERAAAIHFIELLRTGKYRNLEPSGDSDNESTKDYSKTHHLPGGVFRQNQFTIAWRYQERIIPLVDADQHHVDVSRANRVGNVREETRYHPYALFANLLMPQVSGAAARFARAQAGIDLALVACALERYRLATGRYPDDLGALTSKFLAKIPPDVITGRQLRYRLAEDSRFVLYSVGWNERDDNGAPGLIGRNQRFDPRTGDWVWRYSVKPLAEPKP